MNGKHPLKRFLTFSSAIWLLAVCAVFYLIAVPPLQDAWAHFFWKRVPCKVTLKDGKFTKFLYNYDGRSRNSAREDFWVRNRAASWSAANISDTSANFDQICYVSPSNPNSAVLNLTAHKRWDRAVNSLFLSGFVICVATALAVVSRIRRKKAANAAVQTP